MLDNIISIYSQQLELYSKISDILSKYDKDSSIDITGYLKELEVVEKTIDEIKELRNSVEILKEIYVSDNSLKDFSGEEIKKMEGFEDYNKLKNVINALTAKISDIKKMQDRIISNINIQMDMTKKLLQEVNNSKKAVLSYKKPDITDKCKYLNSKK